MTLVAKVEKNGKLMIPVNVRRILGIREGASDLLLHIDEEKRSITIETRDQALERIRTRLKKYIPDGTLLSEELLADRREEWTRA